MKNHAHLSRFYIRFSSVVSSKIIYWKIRFPGNFKFSPTLVVNNLALTANGFVFTVNGKIYVVSIGGL